MSKTIGIDLGTTNSCVAYHDGQREFVIETAEGSLTMPSAVAVFATQSPLVGEAAIRQQRGNIEYTFVNVKRIIGRPYNDDEDMALGPHVAEGPNGEAWLRGPDRQYSPEEVQATVLQRLKANAEARLGETVSRAVISVPAAFDNIQIAATVEAGKLAGFKRVEVLPEPTAAALAYGFDRQKYTRVAVFDMGGGTFDIALLDFANGQPNVVMTDGNSQLGGINFDKAIVDYVCDLYQAEHGDDLRDARKRTSLMKIVPEAELAKKVLSTEKVADIEVTYVAMDRQGAMRHITYPLTREQFEELTATLVREAMRITQRCLDKAERTIQQVDAVVMVGGMSRMPAVRSAVQEFFGKTPLSTVSADHAIAIGAAIYGAHKDGRLAGRFSFEDKTASAYGLEIENGVNAQIMPAGSAYGAEKTVVMTTLQNGQSVIPLTILQGDNPDALENTRLAYREIMVKPGPAGEAEIEITMAIDEAGQLGVIARDLAAPGGVLQIVGGEP